MKKHTPLPWHVEGGLRCAIVAHSHNYVIASEIATENAAYIVAACNAYPKLNELLEQSEYRRGLAEGALSRLLAALTEHPSADLFAAVDSAKDIIERITQAKA